MIREMKPLSLAETEHIVKENKGKEELGSYFKKFVVLKLKDALELRKELEALGNHKIKQEYVVKIIDLLPEDASDVHKIFIDVGLDENEVKQILDIVSKYK
ncbi:hypothetical protein J4466_00280 [Candidatus Pacearchaeota archaeon]|nr:hypothetical protein [Candidatus Pacearchaeota archaeon]